MIELEVMIQVKEEKLVEFSQSITSIKPALELLCSSLRIIEVDNTITILMTMETEEELTTALCTKEFGILLGTIQTLAEKSDIIIHTPYKKEENLDIQEIRTETLERKNKN